MVLEGDNYYFVKYCILQALIMNVKEDRELSLADIKEMPGPTSAINNNYFSLIVNALESEGLIEGELLDNLPIYLDEPSIVTEYQKPWAEVTGKGLAYYWDNKNMIKVRDSITGLRWW